MEALEQGMRAASLADGANALKILLEKIDEHTPGMVACPKCGAAMGSLGRRTKELVTMLGEIDYDRSYYACTCPGCDGRIFPKDNLLDVKNTSFSPGVRRLMSRCGARDSFAKGEDDLLVFSGIRVGEKDIERVSEAIGADIEKLEQSRREAIFEENIPAAIPEEPIATMYIAYDGTGVPVTKRETAGRKGKQEDGSAKTREAKLGCVFTQVGTDSQGRPVRVDGSTTYTGAIETAEDFGRRLYAEALTRGLMHAKTVVVLGDGARWIWNLAELHFPGAWYIVDLYHAREHLYALHKLIAPSGTRNDPLAKEWLAWLENGAIEKIIASASELLPDDERACKIANTEMDYFRNNAERMRYAEFRDNQFFVGSGVVEAGCKNIIAARMKKSGAKWSVRGANAIIALRCSLASSRFEDYWAYRAAA
jgi:hypothetical protein